ncbi:MAG: DUF411 domain-containing protein [Zoogloeaceae bacterium]|nr:DUF411 domain-containing protein [Zoogloeaceae bacterium]
MKKLLSISLAVLFLGSSLAQAADQEVEVYKSPYCGCCGGWVKHMEDNGFKVKTHNVDDVSAARAKLGMPEKYGSCHTARIGNYLIEGHVPAADVKRLLKEKPKAVGLAAPGMPGGSPGMESAPAQPYEVFLVEKNGGAKVFARH